MPAHPGRRPNKPLDETDLEKTEEYNKFMATLEEFHQKRGTEFIREPDLGRKVLDLRKLYEKILSMGGYDEVTIEKGAWRTLAQNYKPIVSNTNAGFLLKTIYYKYLAAFEIADHWKEEPPKKELLEDLSAAGGAIRTRTADFYANKLTEAQSPSKEDAATPVLHRNASQNDNDSPAPTGLSSTGRTLRGAPQKRVLYQPDTTPSRPRHQPTPTQTSSQPQLQNMNGPPSALKAPQAPVMPQMTHLSAPSLAYQPQHTLAPNPRPVPTPANTPHLFSKQSQAQKHSALVAARDPVKVPGLGHLGPPSLHRIIMAIRSALPDEIDWGLTHLLEYTFAHGDELRFMQFPNLAEVLLERMNGITSLVECKAPKTTINSETTQTSTQDTHGSEGPDSSPSNFTKDKLQTREWTKQRNRLFEAALAVRNLALLEENARYLARQKHIKDVLIRGITADSEVAIEYRIYCLEIIEQLATFLHLTEDDALFQALQQSILSADRGECLVALRSLSRYVIRDETNQIRKVTDEVMQVVSFYLLIPDEDIVTAVLDFLYQYTSEDENVDYYLEAFNALDNVKQIARLLSFHAEFKFKDVVSKVQKTLKKPNTASNRDIIPSLPADLVKDLQGYAEPERATQWMRCSFEADPEAEITQIALWQAYQQRFGEFVSQGRGLLPAADFIKNVSVAFKTAQAMVVPSQPGQPQKFIIRGIRPRSVPLSTKGDTYHACLWNTVNSMDGTKRQCDKFKSTPKDLYYHIIQDHLPNPEMQPSTPQVCQWSTCKAFTLQGGTTDRKLILPHIRCHMPDKSPKQIESENAAASHKKSAPSQNHVRMTVQVTPVDEKGEPHGVPFIAALVLRNLARTGSEVGKVNFSAARDKIFEVLCENKAMAPMCTEILQVWEDGGAAAAAAS